jgi:hypothetical protein
MSKIRSAAKRFGVQISDGDSKSRRSFSQPYVWQPFGPGAPIDPHDNDYDKSPVAAYDQTLGGRADVTPGANVPGVAVKGGYDAHDEPYGPKQMYALYLLANDEVCPGGQMCAGASCPDHGTEEDAMDGVSDYRDGFGGKQAAPFKKGGGRQGDDDKDDESRQLPDAHDEMSDYEDDDAEGAVDDYDEDEDEHESDAEDEDDRDDQIDLSLAAALEKTICTCYQMAEVIDDKDLRTMLARARRQVRDLQHLPGKDVDISRKLEELRSEFGDPETITVSDGLRAIAQAGFADVMKPRAS